MAGKCCNDLCFFFLHCTLFVFFSLVILCLSHLSFLFAFFSFKCGLKKKKTYDSKFTLLTTSKHPVH